MNNTLAGVLCSRGVSRHSQGDLAGALADLDQALELNPGYPEAYNNRGATRQAGGDLAGHRGFRQGSGAPAGLCRGLE